MSDLDAKLSLHAGGCGVYQYQPCTCLSAGAAREVAALRAKNEAMRKALEDVLQAWSFNDYQHHTHSWHTREDWIGRHPVVLELARTALGGSHA